MRTAGRKPRLPSLLSYPIGAERIASAIESAPQFEELELSFSSHPGASAQAFQHAVRIGDPHLVLRAAFDRWEKSPSIGDEAWLQKYLRGRWVLNVYPVARSSKSLATVALRDVGLPAIAAWLKAERTESWLWGSKRCDIMFMPGDGTLRIEEFEQAG